MIGALILLVTVLGCFRDKFVKEKKRRGHVAALRRDSTASLGSVMAQLDKEKIVMTPKLMSQLQRG